jgi:hypothetical protein
VKIFTTTACAALMALTVASVAWAEPTTERVSVSSAEMQTVSHSFGPVAVSSDGRFVAFGSRDGTLVPGDSNGVCDTFVRDRTLDVTERVSVSSAGKQGNGVSCAGIALSADGRFAAFGSRASNLVAHDTNSMMDVFLHDRVRGWTRRVSITSDDQQLTAPNGSRWWHSRDPAISGDGQRIAFMSSGRVVPGDTAFQDVYVRDRRRGTTRRVSVSSAGVPGNNDSFQPAIAGDGAIVAFSSSASNLVEPDANLNNPDIFIRILATARTRRVSVDSDEQQLLDCGQRGSTDPSLDEHGDRVVFTEPAPGCPSAHVMLRDRVAGTTQQLEQGLGGAEPDDASDAAGISADGGTVIMQSWSTNLVADDTNATVDVFLIDVASGAITRVSVSAGGAQANAGSGGPAISADARFVAFVSRASNLVVGDTNDRSDVFVCGPLE